MDRLPFDRGSHFSYHGHPCVYHGVAANGRCQFTDGAGWMLEVSDPETGLPVWPFPDRVRELMADQYLILRADPLDDPIRRRARSEEGTREELSEAKCKSKPGQSRDPWYYLREETLRAWDDPDIERCSLTRVAIPKYAVDQLVHEQLLMPVGHPYIIAHYDGVQLHAAELARSQQLILDMAVPLGSLVDPVPLHRVARGIGGGLKPWGRIFSALLGGRIPYASTDASIDRILISRADASAVRTFRIGREHRLQRGQYLCQRDAAEVLNLPLKHVKHLPGVATPGGAHCIPWRRLRRLARTRVTLAELGALTGLHGTTLEARLEREGHFRRDVFGWPRSVLETAATWTGEDAVGLPRRVGG